MLQQSGPRPFRENSTVSDAAQVTSDKDVTIIASYPARRGKLVYIMKILADYLHQTLTEL